MSWKENKCKSFVIISIIASRGQGNWTNNIELLWLFVCLIQLQIEKEYASKCLRISFVSVFYSFANIFYVYLCSFYVQVNYSGVALWGTSYLALTLAVSNKCAFEDVENDILWFPPSFHFLDGHFGSKLPVAFFFTQSDRDWERESVGAPNNLPRWVRQGQVCTRILWGVLERWIKPPLTCFQPFWTSSFFEAEPKHLQQKNMFGRLSHHKAPDSCVLGVVWMGCHHPKIAMTQ